MLRSSKSCTAHFIFLKTASRVLRRLLAEIKRRTDPVTIQINQRFVSVVIRRKQRFEIQN
ncbi:hypothetical protein V1478_002378 [Vespula squamosa]|uniref:Uncharacterized protein n=1 Tax=Vespula squamosa TaxID=30214 RepID=A0ABD2BVU7_VESSQ